MIKKCEKDVLEQCIDIAFMQNNLPQNSCAYCSNLVENIRIDFELIINNPNCLMVGYFNDNELTAILGCFVNDNNNWVDCCGPFFRGEYNQDVAKDMFLFAKSYLSNAARFNFYFNVENKNTHELMQILGANRQDNEYILSIKRSDYKPQKIKKHIVKYINIYEKDVITLHNECFPDVYVDGRDLISAIAKTREIFCALDENDEFVGYGVLSFNNDRQGLVAEIFAVREEKREKGFGWALLNTVVDYGFTEYNGNKIDLVVDKLNNNARKLYYSCGFKLQIENESFFIK